MKEHVCMVKKIPSGCECNEYANELSGLQGGSWPCPTGKTVVCAHQPVPWKRNEELKDPTSIDKKKSVALAHFMGRM